MIISSPDISVFGRDIPVYGICFYAGIFLASAAAVLICPKKKIERFDLVCSAVYTMIGAMIGAKLLFIAVSIRQIIQLEIPLEAVIKGGFVFYGGLLGGAAGLIIYLRQFKLPALPFLDLYAFALPLGHAVGRVGCFFAGCCYGLPYDGPISCTYVSTAGMTPLGVPLFPIQLLEAALLVALFSVQCVSICIKPGAQGVQVCTYCFVYPVIRFTLEFFRGDAERGEIGVLSTSQIVSVIIIVACAAYIFIIKNRKNFIK